MIFDFGAPKCEKSPKTEKSYFKFVWKNLEIIKIIQLKDIWVFTGFSVWLFCIFDTQSALIIQDNFTDALVIPPVPFEPQEPFGLQFFLLLRIEFQKIYENTKSNERNIKQIVTKSLDLYSSKHISVAGGLASVFQLSRAVFQPQLDHPSCGLLSNEFCNMI